MDLRLNKVELIQFFFSEAKGFRTKEKPSFHTSITTRLPVCKHICP